MRDIDDLLEDLVAQIRFNCELACLRQAGGFSICGLAMRLKELYKWEHGLAPWEEDEPKKVLDWVGHKEEYWETIEHFNFQEIRIGGKSLEPMDMESVNSILVPMGLYYGAGLSEGIAPSFFLGILENTNEILGIKVNVISKELARDLVVSPAMSRQKIIIVRKEPLLQYLWNEILFAKTENRIAFYECFRSYGLKEWNFTTIKRLLTRIAEEYIPALIHHEIGEILEESMKLERYHSLIKKYKRTVIELLLRSLRDLLADTHEMGRFSWIVQTRNLPSLSLSVALLDGFMGHIYSDIKKAYKAFLLHYSWDAISEAVLINRQRGKELLNEAFEILDSPNLTQEETVRMIRQSLLPKLRIDT